MQTNDMKFRLWNMVLVLALMMGSVVIAPAPAQAQEGQNRVMLPMVVGGQTPDVGLDLLDLELLVKELDPPLSAAAELNFRPKGCDEQGRSDWTDHCWVSQYHPQDIKSGHYVKAIQLIVWCQGFGSGGIYDFVNGTFGSDTRQAVIEFQRANRIGVDGIVGPQTWFTLQRKLQYNRSDAMFHFYGVQGRCSGDYFGVSSGNFWITKGIWIYRAPYSGFTALNARWG